MKTKKELNIQIGERIRYSRETSELTQEKLAEMIDVSIQYISDLERGVVGTSIPTMIKLCETLKVSSDYILLGRIEKNDLSDIIERLRFLSPNELQIVEKGINVLLEAISCR